MKKSYRPIVQLFGIVFLLTFLFTPVVSAQPATQYLNVLGNSFRPWASADNYASNGGCIYSNGAGGDDFSFPLLLPRGSVIKFLEFFYYDTNPATLTNLSIRKYNPVTPVGVNNSTLVSVSTAVNTGYDVRISAEQSITVETDCSVDPQCFYILNWHTITPTDTQRLCGARVHYIPPFGAVALPLIQRN